MAVYKVPQDVEADDKLLGPFSFRQFIYLIIALMGITIGWGLAQLFVPLAILPLPIVILFGALALPLKKDQPMEVYLAALISFYMKPRKRLWQADGVQSLVEIVAPKAVEEHRTKELSQSEAERRLSYLANIVDSRGWAVRGVDVSQAASPMQPDAFYEAQRTPDILDDSSTLTHTFDNMIDKAETKRRQETIKRMSQPADIYQIPPTPDPYVSLTPPEPSPGPVNDVPDTKVTFNPYPEAMHQSVIQPVSAVPVQTPAQPQPTPKPAPQPQPTPPPTTSNPPVSPDIIKLVNNSTGLSVASIEHEAERIRKKEEQSSDDEVLISLR